MARYIAKNIVGASIAKRCEVQLSYCIGVAKPMSIHVDTYSTGVIEDEKIKAIVNEVFDLRPASIIKKLGLKNPIYKRFAAYGHFGREDDCSWEKLDMVSILKSKLEG